MEWHGRLRLYFLTPIRPLVRCDANAVPVAFYSESGGDSVKVWVDGTLYDEGTVCAVDNLLPKAFPVPYQAFGREGVDYEGWKTALTRTVGQVGVSADRQSIHDRLAVANLPPDHILIHALDSAAKALDAIAECDSVALRAAAEEVNRLLPGGDVFEAWVRDAQLRTSPVAPPYWRRPEDEWLAHQAEVDNA